MKRLLVASMFAATSIFVVVPTTATADMAADSSVAKDKPEKAEKDKKDKKAPKAKKAPKVEKSKKAKKSSPPRPGLDPLQRQGTVGLDALADSEKLTICHRTNSDNNPYVQITPATAGVAHAHDGHAGGLYNPTLKPAGIKWGDIIPPYVYRGTQYPGQNWTVAGQTIFNNGCDLPDEVAGPPIVVATVAPSVVPPTCEEDGRLILPVDENVFYTPVPAGTGPGVHTVTATPEVEHVLSGQTQWVIEVQPRLGGDECTGVAGTFASVDDDSLLPDTGGVVWWLMVIAGLLVAAGTALAVGTRRRP